MFKLGSLHIYWYGTVVLSAILFALLITWLNVKKRQEDFSAVIDILLITLPLGIFFGRSVYVFYHWYSFAGDLFSILEFTEGGLSIYGAFIGFLLGSVVYCHYTAKNLWHWMDVLIPGMVAGLIIMQIGNFFMQNTIGLPISSTVNDHSLVAYVSFKQRPYGFESYLYFKPVALYQAGVLFFIFCFSLILSYMQYTRRKINSGDVFLLSIILIGICRFVFGFMYLGTQEDILPHFGQLMPLFMTLCAMALYCYRRRQYHKEHTYHFE